MMNAPGCLIALALSLVPPLYLNAVRLAWRYEVSRSVLRGAAQCRLDVLLVRWG